jgi:hypothetical protein
MATLSGYTLSGFDISLYCKLTEYGINTNNYMCVMSFVTGMNNFCMTAAYKSTNPYEIYIDRVEKNNLCVLNGVLTDFDEGLEKTC